MPDHIVTKILDQYCLARVRRDVTRQVEIADRLVDEVVPTLLSLLYPADSVDSEETLG